MSLQNISLEHDQSDRSSNQDQVMNRTNLNFTPSNINSTTHPPPSTSMDNSYSYSPSSAITTVTNPYNENFLNLSFFSPIPSEKTLLYSSSSSNDEKVPFVDVPLAEPSNSLVSIGKNLHEPVIIITSENFPNLNSNTNDTLSSPSITISYDSETDQKNSRLISTGDHNSDKTVSDPSQNIPMIRWNIWEKLICYKRVLTNSNGKLGTQKNKKETKDTIDRGIIMTSSKQTALEWHQFNQNSDLKMEDSRFSENGLEFDDQEWLSVAFDSNKRTNMRRVYTFNDRLGIYDSSFNRDNPFSYGDNDTNHTTLSLLSDDHGKLKKRSLSYSVDSADDIYHKHIVITENERDLQKSSSHSCNSRGHLKKGKIHLESTSKPRLSESLYKRFKKSIKSVFSCILFSSSKSSTTTVCRNNKKAKMNQISPEKSLTLASASVCPNSSHFILNDTRDNNLSKEDQTMNLKDGEIGEDSFLSPIQSVIPSSSTKLPSTKSPVSIEASERNGRTVVVAGGNANTIKKNLSLNDIIYQAPEMSSPMIIDLPSSLTGQGVNKPLMTMPLYTSCSPILIASNKGVPGSTVGIGNNGNNEGLDMIKPSNIPLLPPVSFFSPSFACESSPKGSKKTLILDLDETLIHSTFHTVIESPDFSIELHMDFNKTEQVYIKKRPFVDEFLDSVSQLYEVVIFTASLPSYANAVIDKLDPFNNRITHRLFRDSCVFFRGQYVKDLSIIGRRMDHLIIVDNSPISYLFQPHQAIPIPTWYSDPMDDNLLSLLDLLREFSLEQYTVMDLPHLKNRIFGSVRSIGGSHFSEFNGKIERPGGMVSYNDEDSSNGSMNNGHSSTTSNVISSPIPSPSIPIMSSTKSKSHHHHQLHTNKKVSHPHLSMISNMAGGI